MTSQNIHVLITSVGSTGAQSFIKSFSNQTKYDVSIIGCDADSLATGRHMVDVFYTIPFADDPTYIDEIRFICESNSVDLFIPVMEPELEAVAKAHERLLRFRPVVSSERSITTCNDKTLTDSFLRSIGIRTPHAYSTEEEIVFPCILKPRRGTGSQGIEIINDEVEWEHRSLVGSEAIVQQFIQGREYSVDVFGMLNGEFVGAVPRLRLMTKGGLAVRTVTVDCPEIVILAEKICRSLSIVGPANIQFIESEQGEFYCIDINPRLGGAYIASIKAGLNAPIFLLDQVVGNHIEYCDYQRGVLMSRYWEEVYDTDYLV